MADPKETKNSAGTTISGDSRQTHELSRYINSKYQDSVFKDLFKSRANLLDLYRTLHPEDSLIKEEDLTLITIKNVLSNGVYNDVAFQAKDRLMILFEHQSSINWNMPLRLLIYYAEEIMGYLRQEGDSLHQKDRILLPAVEFYVVYSGSEKWDVTRLCLSDSFKEKNGFLELTVKVIHKNDYRESILDDYLTFIYKVKENIDTYGRDEKNIRQAVLEAIDYCMENNILAGYLADRKREVFGMLMNEISVDEFGEIREREGELRGRREGRREGRKEGRREEEARFIISMYRKGYSLEQIAGVAEKSVEEIQAVIFNKEPALTI